MIRIAAMAFFAMAFSAGAANLQRMIDEAAPGATVRVPAGVYDAVVIDKPLTLCGDPGATIRGDGESHVVQIKADHVKLDGFHICHSGLDLSKDCAGIFVTGDFATISNNLIDDSLHGIYLKKVTDCRILANRIHGKTDIAAPAVNNDALFRPDAGETCSTAFAQGRRGNGIHIWNCERIVLRDNEIINARDGIYFSFTDHSEVTGNVISHVRFGLHYMYSDYNIFESNRFFDNTAGASIMYSKGLLVSRNTFSRSVGHRSYGLALTAVDYTRFEENQIIGNSVGIHMQMCNGNQFIGNNVSCGYIGVRIATSSNDNRFSQNIFANNMHPVEIDGAPGDNAWAIDHVGNRWGSGSGEIDLAGKGVGSMPHREVDLLGRLRSPFPIAGLLSGSPAIDLVRFAQQHAKIPKVPAIVDPAPLTAGYHGGSNVANTVELSQAKE